MLRPIVLLLVLISLEPVIGQEALQERLMRSVYLVGNVANIPCDDPLLLGLRNLTAGERAPYTVIYSGDLIDDDGLEKEDCEDEEEKLRGLIEIATNNLHGSVLFVPGERDWDNAGRDGLEKVKRLEAFLEKELKSKRVLVPTKGCPGPMVIDVGDDLRIIAVNTQWFQHQYMRPGESDTECDFFNDSEFYDEIDDYMEEVPGRNIIIAAHHPIYSYGQSAGYRSIRRHLFPLTDLEDKLYVPLPILGSFYAGYRRNVGSKKDLTNAGMREFSRRMARIMDQYKHVIYASAHELDLQVLYHSNNFHINSGSMEKALAVANGEGTIFKKKRRGFVKLEYFTVGTVKMKVFYQQKDHVVLGHEQLLMESYNGQDSTAITVNTRFVPYHPTSEGKDSIMDRVFPDRATITPGAHYNVGKLRRWIFGEHYRATWTTPISNIPYLDLDTTYGGLTPYARGGGGQTYVLKFYAPDGQRYYFRSIDKDPFLSLSQDQALMSGVYGKIMKDLTSGQYPYSSFVTDKLMDAAGIYHTSPRLVIMPDDPKLGLNRELFAGMLGRFELEPKGYNKDVEGFMGAERVVKTFRMFQYILEDNDHKVDASSYARARLFDLLVSDWDRQPDNWKFMGFGEKKAQTFYALPKDRDRAFSRWEGIYWLLDQEYGSPRISGFNYKWGDFKSLTFKARHIDRIVLNELDLQQWKNIAQALQADLNDEVIDAAWQNIPPEAQGVSAEKMKDIMKVRRGKLLGATVKYYKMMAKYVDIIGSNKREVFELERLPDGDVEVTVFKKKKTGEKDALLYKRLFRKAETKEIRLHGLEKEDEFYIKGEAKKSILIRVITGKGQDFISDQSSVNGLKKYTLIYDHNKEDSLAVSQEAKMVKTKKPIEFTHKLWEPHSYFPLPSFVYNKDDGFGLGFGLSLTRQGFQKPGYAKKYYFRGAVTTNENFWFQAASDFHHIIGEWDWLLSCKVSNSERSFRHFYGIGNETRKDNNLKKVDYYENHTNIEQFTTGLRRKFWERSHFALSAGFERYWVRSENTLDHPLTIYDEQPGLQGMGRNAYFGSQQEIVLNLADAAYLPTKGVKFQLSHLYYYNTSDVKSSFGRLSADMRFYETVRTWIPVTIGLRGGYLQAYGDVPFFYLARLGQRDNLRGYLRNRFTGDQAVYFNTDVRFDLGTIQTVVVPFGVGVTVFSDIGKIWVDGEDSDKWHRGDGIGIYLSPVNENFNLTFTAARSEEEKVLFELTFGFGL